MANLGREVHCYSVCGTMKPALWSVSESQVGSQRHSTPPLIYLCVALSRYDANLFAKLLAAPVIITAPNPFIHDTSKCGDILRQDLFISDGESEMHLVALLTSLGRILNLSNKGWFSDKISIICSPRLVPRAHGKCGISAPSSSQGLGARYRSSPWPRGA